MEVTQSREITFHVKYLNGIMFAKIFFGGELPGLPVPGCGPGENDRVASLYTVHQFS